MISGNMIAQVMMCPRKEPTFEEKVKLEDCTTIYNWIMKHYDASLLDQGGANASST